MVEYVEELDVEPQPQLFGQGKPFREVEVAPGEIGTAQRVATEVAELAVRGAVAAEACARARIYGGDERVGIEPLQRPRLRDVGNGIVFVERHAGNDACELRAAAVARCRCRWPNRAC